MQCCGGLVWFGSYLENCFVTRSTLLCENREGRQNQRLQYLKLPCEHLLQVSAILAGVKPNLTEADRKAQGGAPS